MHPTYRQPDHSVGIRRVSSAAGVLLVAGTVDNDGILEGSCKFVSHELGTKEPECARMLVRHSRTRGIPFLDASRGLMSKMSMPCIFPMSSRRSRPVACSTSDGTVPGLAPGGRRSSSVLISVRARNASQSGVVQSPASRELGSRSGHAGLNFEDHAMSAWPVCHTPTKTGEELD